MLVDLNDGDDGPLLTEFVILPLSGLVRASHRILDRYTVKKEQVSPKMLKAFVKTRITELSLLLFHI